MTRWATSLGSCTGIVAVVVLASMILPPCLGCKRSAGVGQVSTRGPGMQRHKANLLDFLVPRTFELTHLEPTQFAAALGKDPARIFEFVRDQIGYEAYSGCLRGPRGTLMAMAGNSVDRAALLGSLLEAAGHRVRYARGTLPEREARELVTTMWTQRQTPAWPGDTGEPSAGVRAASQTFLAAAKRDYSMIRTELASAGLTGSSDTAPSFSTLVAEARAHYWVQWAKGDKWLDLDPLFGEATPGRTYAPTADILPTLPDSLFHRVTIRIRVEEDTAGKVSSRNVLDYSARAADLSGRDLVLLHEPDNWRIDSTLGGTGRVKPVLLAGAQKFVVGQPFQLWIGPFERMGDLLRGPGTRAAPSLATAESVEIDFVDSEGKVRKVVREVFDVVGKARRLAGQWLGAEELRRATGASDDLTQRLYSFYFTNGRVDPSHVLHVAEENGPRNGRRNLQTLLRRIHVAFAATSDGLVGRLRTPDRGAILFYPDSPRVHILDLSMVPGVPVRTVARLCLDLRSDRARAVALSAIPSDLFNARILRGVVDGTLERVLIEYVTGQKETKSPRTISTSSVFGQAATEHISPVLIHHGAEPLEAELPPEALARLVEDLEPDYLAVAPQRAVNLGNLPRFAWWRIDRRSGETIAVTDEGLHQAVIDDDFEVDPDISIAEIEWGHGQKARVSLYTDALSPQAMQAFVRILLANGVSFIVSH